MKTHTYLLLLALPVVMVGCKQQDRRLPEVATASNSSSAKAQEEQIVEATKTAKKQIEAQAKAQKEQIEAQAKAARAQIEAKKAEARAQAVSTGANLSAQARKIQEAAGTPIPPPAPPASNQSVQGAASTVAAQATAADRSMEEHLRRMVWEESATSTNVNVEVRFTNGVATLRGQVPSLTEKTNLESKIKSMPGVTQVQNDLQVK